MNTKEQMPQREVEPVLSARDQLLKAAREVFYDDNRRFIKRHLEVMADLADKYEKMGYEVIVDADTSDFGRIVVLLGLKDRGKSPIDSNSIEVKVYEMTIDPTEFKKESFDNPYPSKESLRKAFDDAAAKIEKIKARNSVKND